MSREIILRPEAETELTEAFEWYEERVPGLGSAFLLAVDAVFRGIIRNPQQYPVIHKATRRALVRRFPYQVLFVIETSRVVVLAVFHVKRDPKRWQERS